MRQIMINTEASVPSPDSGGDQTSQTAELKPIAATKRLDVLDILRGFALIGILLMNIEWFGRPISELGQSSTVLTDLDYAVGWLIRCFVEGKFYKLFALLFGMGFAVMLNRAIEVGRPFGAWFIRRMLVLYVMGILHLWLLWEGDILHDYAIAGLMLLGMIYLVRSKRFERFNNPTSFLKIALWWLSVPLLIASLVGLGFSTAFDSNDLNERIQQQQQIMLLVDDLQSKAKEEPASLTAPADEISELSPLGDEVAELSATEQSLPERSVDADDATLTKIESPQGDVQATSNEEDAEADEQSPEHQAQAIFDEQQEHQQDVADEIAALKNGSYWQATVFRVKASMFRLAITPGFVFTMLLPIFMLGYWLVTSGVIRNHQQHSRLFRYLALLGLGIGLFMTVGGLMIMSNPLVKDEMILQGVGNVLFAGGQFFMAAGYLGALVRMLARPRWHERLSILAPFGRMALTNYIMHSIILTSIFYGYAGGMYGEISRAPQMLLVLGILLVQIPLSGWWLKQFQFGPLEWLWRSLTYKKWQSFKVVPT
jgi:uncharacterized protein